MSGLGTVGVVGVGGVGGMLTARVALAGGDVVCVATPRTAAAIRERGLRLEHEDAVHVARPRVAERLAEPVALLVVAVKAHVLDDALDRVDRDALRSAVVLPLLNGLEHVARLRTGLDVPVAAGSIGRLEAFAPEPGVVVQRTPGARIAAASEALGRDALERALAPLRVPGVEVAVEDDERAVLWEKAARLAVLAAATVASGEPVGALRDDPTWRARLETALAEACAVAAADGVALDPAAQWAIIDAMPADLTTSTARDVAAGRPSELDAIAGSVVRAALRVGVPAPTLAELLDRDAVRT